MQRIFAPTFRCFAQNGSSLLTGLRADTPPRWSVIPGCEGRPWASGLEATSGAAGPGQHRAADVGSSRCR